jgi:N-acetylglucosaminyl-diphospho-decaprenol L-rhamnosyltransferase
MHEPQQSQPDDAAERDWCTRLAAVAGRATAGDCSVTAVIATYNSSRHLAPLAKLMATWSVRPGRTLIVDNASTDNTPEIAGANGLEVLRNSQNRGFGAACNKGLQIAGTEYVLLCNPDVRPASDALAALLNALAETPSAAVAGASLGNEPAARRFSRLTASIAGFLPRRVYRGLKGARRERTPAAGVERLPVVDYVEGAFMLCRVAALRSVGGFDERFFLYHEEEDLCRRLAERGWLTLLVPGAQAEHDHGSSSEGVGEGAMTAFRLHSLYWYHRKYHPRAYAELARLAVAACVLSDRLCRALTRRRQIYSAGAASAAFSSIGALREKHGVADRQRGA